MQPNHALLRGRGHVCFDMQNGKVSLEEGDLARALADLRRTSRSTKMGRFEGEVASDEFTISARSGDRLRIRHPATKNEIECRSIIRNELPIWRGLGFEMDGHREVVIARYAEVYEDLAFVLSAMLLLYMMEGMSLGS